MMTVLRLTPVPDGHQCSEAGQLASLRRLATLTGSTRCVMAPGWWLWGVLALLFPLLVAKVVLDGREGGPASGRA